MNERKTSDERVKKAQQLRGEGLSYREIGKILGVWNTTVTYWLNPTVRQRQARYRQEHKSERGKYSAMYYREHKTDILLRNAKYNREHRNERAQRDAAHYQEHKVEELQRNRKYYREHKAESNAYASHRRALKVSALAGATAAQLAEIAEIYRRAKEDKRVRCYLCGKLIPIGYRHVDHITPLSKGGAHRPSNLAVACDTCNLSKGANLPRKVGVLI